MKYLKLCFVLLLLAWVSVAEAQTTKVRGKVVGCRNGGTDAIGEYRVCGYHDWGHD